MAKSQSRIAFQGEPGANSHLAARDAYSRMEALACPTFEDGLRNLRLLGAVVTSAQTGGAAVTID